MMLMEAVYQKVHF